MHSTPRTRDSRGRFTCELCTKSFKTPMRLEIHFKQRHENGGHGFYCSICDRTFEDRDKSEEHRLAHRSNPVCHICSASFSSTSNLSAHIKRHFTCEKGSGPPLKNTGQEQEDTAQVFLMCSVCRGYIGNNQLEMAVHRWRAHRIPFDKDFQAFHHAGNPFQEAFWASQRPTVTLGKARTVEGGAIKGIKGDSLLLPSLDFRVLPNIKRLNVFIAVFGLLDGVHRDTFCFRIPIQYLAAGSDVRIIYSYPKTATDTRDHR